MSIEFVSVEVTNRCGKGCDFCYNASGPGGGTRWRADELVSFATDLAANGVKAVSFGGGEPLEFGPIVEVLERLRGVLARTMTTNGLLLKGALLDRLIRAAPDNVQVSIHFPEREGEVRRVVAQVEELEGRGIRSGVNFLVARSKLETAVRAAAWVRGRGIGNDRIVYLPMKRSDTPTPDEMGRVAGAARFQSMSCLLACGASPRFASVAWDRSVAWCSYTATRRVMTEPTHRGLTAALAGLGLEWCGSRRVAV
jgi:MoaA/NifB/PqqE/SkfB family radical SAM enzyme